MDRCLEGGGGGVRKGNFHLCADARGHQMGGGGASVLVKMSVKEKGGERKTQGKTRGEDSDSRWREEIGVCKGKKVSYETSTHVRALKRSCSVEE